MLTLKCKFTIRRSFHQQKNKGTRKDRHFGTKKMTCPNEDCQKKTLARYVSSSNYREGEGGDRQITSFDIYDILCRAEQIIHNSEYEHFISCVDFRQKKRATKEKKG